MTYAARRTWPTRPACRCASCRRCGRSIGGRVQTAALRDLRIEDLLGRTQVETDLASVRALLAGRRVLVTGAGGSIGSEIARQVAGCGPAAAAAARPRRDPPARAAAASLDDGRSTALLADIRHREHVVRLFLQHRPEVVFHAAAHKHVPLLEAHPCEAVQTNVSARGTSSTPRSARRPSGSSSSPPTRR